MKLRDLLTMARHPILASRILTAVRAANRDQPDRPLRIRASSDQPPTSRPGRPATDRREAAE